MLPFYLLKSNINIVQFTDTYHECQITNKWKICTDIVNGKTNSIKNAEAFADEYGTLYSSMSSSQSELLDIQRCITAFSINVWKINVLIILINYL